MQIAIVGCGWTGVRHATALDASGAAIRWAVDVDADRAQSLAATYAGAQATASIDDALADDTVGGVVVCLPHALHAEATVAAVEAGKHVLCEKPIATSLRDADRMIAAAERAGVQLMIAENVHFDPAFERVGSILSSGAIGNPALARVARETDMGDVFREQRPWFLSGKQAGGGVLLAAGVHDIEVLRMLLGEVEAVHAVQPRQRVKDMDGEDTMALALNFADAVVAVAVLSLASKRPETVDEAERYSLQIDGSNGCLWLDKGKVEVFSDGSVEEFPVPEVDTFRAEAEHFLECVRTGTEPRTSGRSQRRALEVVLAAYRSLAAGGEIVLG